MRIQVSGKHIDVGDALRTHVEERILDVVGKYAGRPCRIRRDLLRDRHEFVADARCICRPA